MSDVMPAAGTSELVLALAAALVASERRVVTAESCTGGLIAAAITAVPGSSEWFERGFVTYSNEAKRELLGVPDATLGAHGAVSEETARAMADGALAHSRGDVAVAVTGIAGPGGATPDKPVGTVCFAWVVRGSSAESTTCWFAGDRGAVRNASVDFALRGLLARTGRGGSGAGPARPGSASPVRRRLVD